MSAPVPWRRLWDQMDGAMARFGDAQAKATGELLKSVRWAVTRYGEEVDPESFDELGQPIEPKEAEEKMDTEEPCDIVKLIQRRCMSCAEECSAGAELYIITRDLVKEAEG